MGDRGVKGKLFEIIMGSFDETYLHVVVSVEGLEAKWA
jgi:hypothetical protein